jgi:hypothetical protein
LGWARVYTHGAAETYTAPAAASSALGHITALTVGAKQLGSAVNFNM